ncbi:MAG TPA: tetratricopeptide repeat protein [Candidatus Saccharimonadales bacterium]|nr:tetratricopeptide repeat protein [Candidatus Saccharimonadales bacterium]
MPSIPNTRIDVANAALLAGDFATARDEFETLLRLGSKQALVGLATIYERGNKDVPKDVSKAIEYYERAFIEAKSAYAARMLGRFHYHGYGVPMDYDKAFYYYSKLENSTDAVGLLSLGWMYEMGRGVTEDVDKARMLYRRATKLGNIQARKHWGMLELKHGSPLLGVVLWGWAILQGIPLIIVKSDDSRLRSY